jgi:hypothetical protein
VQVGKIDHDYLFIKANGQPLRNLLYTGMRWQRTLSRLKQIRYRRPYTARHTSVSWDLMIGRSALWVARKHGRSIATMLRFYAAWADGTLESDVEAIRASLNSERPVLRPESRAVRRKTVRPFARPFEMEFPVSCVPEAQFATGFATQRD